MNGWFFATAIGASLIGCYAAICHQALYHFSSSKLEELLKKRDREDHYANLMEAKSDLIWLTSLIRAMMNLIVIVMMIAFFQSSLKETTATEFVFWEYLGSAIAIAGVMIMLLGVIIPSSVGRYAAENSLAFSYPLLMTINFIMHPLLRLFRAADWVVRRLAGVNEQEEEESQVEQEILDAMTEGEASGLVDEAQRERIEAVIGFNDADVDEIMTPRTDVNGIDLSWSLKEIKDFIAEHGHSRYPVYEEDLDHIAGVLYVKDLLPLVGETAEDFDLLRILRPAEFIPETKHVNDLLEELKEKKVHVAIVLDEFGGTSGLVTIEDIVEELVGEIQDEHEKEEELPGITNMEDGSFEIDARVHIDDVNDEVEIELPESDDYETIGGFVFASLGHVPEIGENFEYENVLLTVIDAEKTRVNKVRVQIMDESKQFNAPAA